MLFILLSGGMALLWQVQQTRADDVGNIVGAPTLPATMVNAIFAQLGSPMVGTGQMVEQAAQLANIDDAFALGVWWTETNDGAAGVGYWDRNPGGVRRSPAYAGDASGYAIYPSYAAAILDWFNVLKSRYVDRGLTSVYTLCYPYVGTSNAPEWANKVVNLMLRYRGEVPPPTPSPAAHKHFGREPQQVQQAQPRQQGVRPIQGQQLEAHKPLAASPVQPVLPRAIGVSLVMLGLLAALLIALWSMWLARLKPGQPTMGDEPSLRRTSALLLPLPTLSTLDEQPTETHTEELDTLPTPPRVRRIML